ncbi:MAG TPA: glucosaminidase domain-containing protein, partial [Propionicimonas sp.]
MLTLVVGIALSLGAVLAQAPSAQAVSDSGKTKFIAGLVRPAQDSQRKFGVPASVSIAQAIVASAWGKSAPATQAKNYFNTPCSGSMTAAQYADLAEAQVGKPYRLGANGPGVFDCSSLVIWLNNQSGAYRMGDDTAAGMYNRSRAVGGSPAVGDMVFLRNNPARANGIGHMAVLTKKLPSGDWRIIEARGRAYGVVRSTLSFWKKRSYYAGLRRFSKITFANSASATASAASLYQAGCVTIGATSYAKFTSVANSFFGHAAAVAKDAAYKAARA